MLSILGQQAPNCAGLPRREMLRAAGAGLLGLSLPKVLQAEALQATLRTGEASDLPVRAKSVIFMFLFGGPSQYETFDMKPDAPSDIRGPFRPIPSKTSGLLISEHLPRLAQVSDKYCVVRTLSHSFNDHSGGGHYVQTGHRWQVPIGGGFSATPKDWPSMGSVVEYLGARSGGKARDLPNYCVLPNRLGRLQERGQYLRPGEYAGWLGQAYNPLTTRIDRLSLSDNPYWRDMADDEVNFQIEGLEPVAPLELDRLRRRVSLLEQFDAQRRVVEDGHAGALDQLRQRALALVSSERTRNALDVRKEPDATRDLYGRHLFGQATLLSRRLVEAGVRFVTVHYDACDGYSWDSHRDSDDVKAHLLPTFDQALSALLTDLDQRGLLEETLVVAMGEMGRTAKPTKRWGRGHWSTAFPVVLAGGGIPGGSLYGSTDKGGQYPTENAMSPEDLAATIYYALGIDPQQMLVDPSGRPVPLVGSGRAVEELFS